MRSLCIAFLVLILSSSVLGQHNHNPDDYDATTQPDIQSRSQSIVENQQYQKDQLPFLLYRVDNRVCFYTETFKHSYYISNLGRTFLWENTASSFHFEQENGMLTFGWHLDIRGPGWCNINFTQDQDGKIKVIYEATNDPNLNFHTEKTFKSYDEFLKDNGDESNNLKFMMKRWDINPDLPTPAILDAILSNKYPEVDAKTDRACKDLVALLDADEYETREKASEKLSAHEFYIPLLMLRRAGKIELTPEQQSRVDAILCQWRMNATDKVLQQIKDGGNE